MSNWACFLIAPGQGRHLRISLALLASLAAACGSPVERLAPPSGTPVETLPPPPPPPPRAPFVVSNAVAIESAPDQVVFVSLPPGSLPDVGAVQIGVIDRQASLGLLVDGGLDPVAVQAVAGDNLSVTVYGTVYSGGWTDVETLLRYDESPSRPRPLASRAIANEPLCTCRRLC